jgi:hypothetical protein
MVVDVVAWETPLGVCRCATHLPANWMNLCRLGHLLVRWHQPTQDWPATGTEPSVLTISPCGTAFRDSWKMGIHDNRVRRLTEECMYVFRHYNCLTIFFYNFPG